MVLNVVERHVITQSQTGEKEEIFTINRTAEFLQKFLNKTPGTEVSSPSH